MEREADEGQREAARLLPRADTSWSTEPEAEAVLEISQENKTVPFWAWILLVVSVMAFTSSGIIFSMMPEVPPVTLASWRLQATTLLLFPAAVVEALLWMDGDTRRRVVRAGIFLCADGITMGVHFGLWVLSLQLTSLPHAMLFITMSPAIVALGSWVRGRPISRGELAGTVLGVAGGAVLALTSAHHGKGGERDPSWQGDLCALAGASLFVLHLEFGRKLRAFTPMLTYSTVVTGLAASTLVLGALTIESSNILGDLKGHDSFGVLQWVVDVRYIPMIAMLAVVPGVLGHVGYNTLVKHIDALILTLAGSVEPLLGSVVGWMLGLVAAPPLLTYIGGFTVIASTIVVSIAGHARQKKAERVRMLVAGKSQSGIELA